MGYLFLLTVRNSQNSRLLTSKGDDWGEKLRSYGL